MSNAPHRPRIDTIPALTAAAIVGFLLLASVWLALHITGGF